MFALLPFGSIFAGRYRVGRSLASGGMGAVHEVEHIETGRRAALKVMLPHVLNGDGAREQFKSEARVAARLRSEHVVDVLDAGVDEATEMPYLVMELLEGEDLGARLRRAGPMSREEVVTCLAQVARALDRVHRSGIVHRDLKPENLFLTERDDGSPLVKVLDFGISKVLAEGATSALTVEARGTPVYMSPEQFTHEMKVSPATDIYALGMVAYTLLAGGAYWSPEIERGMNVFLIARLAEKGVEEPATARAKKRGVELPAAFDAWFAQVTAVDPKRRFAGAISAVRALADALEVSLPAPSERDRPSFAGPESRPPRRSSSSLFPDSGALSREPAPRKDESTPAAQARSSAPGASPSGSQGAASTASTPPRITPTGGALAQRTTPDRLLAGRATLPRAPRDRGPDDTPRSPDGQPPSDGQEGSRGDNYNQYSMGEPRGERREERPDGRRAMLPEPVVIGSGDSHAGLARPSDRKRSVKVVAGGALIAVLAAAIGFFVRPASPEKAGDATGAAVADPAPRAKTQAVSSAPAPEISVAPALTVTPEPTSSAAASAPTALNTASPAGAPGASVGAAGPVAAGASVGAVGASGASVGAAGPVAAGASAGAVGASGAASAKAEAKRPGVAPVPTMSPTASKKPRYTQD